jgi:hypothetical protein
MIPAIEPKNKQAIGIGETIGIGGAPLPIKNSSIGNKMPI